MWKSYPILSLTRMVEKRGTIQEQQRDALEQVGAVGGGEGVCGGRVTGWWGLAGGERGDLKQVEAGWGS